MAVISKAELKARIEAEITTNGERKITGATVRALLLDLVDSLRHETDTA